MRVYHLTLLLLAVLGLVACDPKNPNNGTEPGETYPEPVAKIFRERNCFGCHNTQDRRGGIAMTTWDELMAGYNLGALVFPYNAQMTHFLWHLNWVRAEGTARATPYMPYTQSNQTDTANTLSAAEMQTLIEWVNNGAPNRNGEIKWANREQSSAGKFFFLNACQDQMGVADLQTGLVMRYVPVGLQPNLTEAPHYIWYSPDRQFVYLTLINGGRVQKLRADNYQLVASSPNLGSQIAHVRPSGDGRFLAVSNWVPSGTNEDALIILDANTLEKIDAVREVSIGRAHGLAVRKDFTRLYLTADEGNYFLTFYLNPSTGRITNQPPHITVIGGGGQANDGSRKPYQATLSSDENLLFISNQTTHSITMYNVSGPIPQLLDEAAGGNTECVQGVGARPKLMTYHNGRLYVAAEEARCFQSAGSMLGCISVLRVENNRLVWERNIYRVGHRPLGLDVDPTRNRLHIVCTGSAEAAHHPPEDGECLPGKYSVIDLSTFEPLFQAPIDVGGFPAGGTVIAD